MVVRKVIHLLCRMAASFIGVRYDYDRSINEAIKITKYEVHLAVLDVRKQPSPEPVPKRELVEKPEALTNGKWSGPSHAPHSLGFGMPSPKSPDFDDAEEEYKSDALDRSNRRRQRPMRYSEKDFVEAVSDNEEAFDSDDEIVGEAVYDEEYLRQRKQRRKVSSSSEGDEEYQWDEENVEDEEEYDQEDSLSISEDSDRPHKVKQLPGRTRRETKLRSVGEIQSGLRRSKRATRNRINYRQYVVSESDTESTKPDKPNATDDHSELSEHENGEHMMESEDSDGIDDEEQEMKVEEPVPSYPEEEKEQNQAPEKLSSPIQEETEGMTKRRFLDLNELAPSSGFDDGPNTIMKDENNNDY
ncbi:DDT domain-containing protein DDR4-like isoform X1 [Senna tora]|uniref:DDT domain-containing protein DDR4-like isoform X1 n=1 Tax=Senna tora TaxID=362788 RepID=A0A834X5P4_9FABA|nr:DDT domain-containing protein DDR4-like isoform X1 [Senna tora]